MSIPGFGGMAHLSARSSRRAGAGLVLLIAMATGAAFVSSSAREATELRSRGVATVSINKLAGSALHMAWRARVRIENAEFRIYRGQDAQSLRRIATLPAKEGIDGYRYQDEAAALGAAIYEVRLVEPNGLEHVVARAFCARTDGLRQAAQPESPAVAADLATVTGVVKLTTIDSYPVTRVAAHAVTSGPQPPVPPPRAGSLTA